MKRHEALHDLSRDHHHGLVMAQRMKRTGEEPGSDDPGSPDLDEVVEAFLAFWEDELAEHLREEEEVLLPIYGRYINLGDDDQVCRLIEDHAWFRDHVHELRERRDRGEPHRSLLFELGQRLDEHARFEDRQLFPNIEQALTDGDLTAVADRSRAYRLQRRGEDAVGPRDQTSSSSGTTSSQ